MDDEVVEEQTEELTEEVEPSEETVEEIEAEKYSKAVQKRIDKITGDKYAALKKVQDLEAQLENKNAGRPIRPSVDKFSNEYGEVNQQSYDTALSNYEDKFFEWKKKNAQDKEFADRARIQHDTQKEKFMVMAEEIRQVHPDFDEVVERPVFSQPLSQALFELEKGAEIAYYLGNHEEEALKIGQLPPVSMTRELNKLLANKFKNSTSNAPPPINPITGTDSGRQKEWKEMSDSEWFRMRERERSKGG